MDWSPILISMKTASVSIVLTFFLGILAAVGGQHEKRADEDRTRHERLP